MSIPSLPLLAHKASEVKKYLKHTLPFLAPMPSMCAEITAPNQSPRTRRAVYNSPTAGKSARTAPCAAPSYPFLPGTRRLDPR